MTTLPSGVVTFMFSDIEGSTRLWERDANAMRSAVARHDDIMATVIAHHGGALFKHVGDAVQAAFADPVAAVRAVAAAQRSLAAEPWSETGPLRVRMALHLGEAAPNAAGDYHQVACLNRLARLLATGYGGQVLLSDPMSRVTADQLPAGSSLRDLGQHRLRDLLDPAQIWQLTISGLPATFPPLKSLEQFANNLPIQPTALIGRATELASLTDLLTDSRSARLVTLTGPGGTGKTRLALQAAADALDNYPDGAFLIELGQVTDPDLVLPTIAQTLGVREGSGLDLWSSLLAHLSDRRLLLVLDNLEQLPGRGVLIAEMLAAAPNFRVLATSRIPLRVAAEHLVEVHPLALPSAKPSSADAIPSSPAVQLFIERAVAGAPGCTIGEAEMPTIARIVRRLDGLPLAIELAAGQIRFYEPAELWRELDHRFRLLTGGDPTRLSHQQALETTIAWSYDLLSPTLQRLLPRLSVFAGGWTYESARQVTAGERIDGSATNDGIRALAEASLVRRHVDASGVSRWSMLESIHVFAALLLDDEGETSGLRQRHAIWFRGFAAEANAALVGADQEQWLLRLEAEHDNLRAALAWELTTADVSPRLPAELWRFWRTRGYLSEGRRWLEGAVSRTAANPCLHLATLSGGGGLAVDQGDYARAQDWYERALVIAREVDDREQETELLNNLGVAALYLGESARAGRRFTEALALSEEIGDQRRRLDVLANLGALAHYRGDIPEATARYSETLRIGKELGDLRGVAETLLNLLLLLAPFPEHRDRARAFGDEALRRCRSLGDRIGEGLSLTGLAFIAESEQDFATAATLHGQSLTIFKEIEDWGNVARATGNLGSVAIDRDDKEAGTDLLRDALRRFDRLGEQDGIAIALEGLAAATDAPERAARLLGAARRLRDEIEVPPPPEGKRRHDTTMGWLREELGASLDQVMAEGRELTTKRAIAFALHGVQDPLFADLDEVLSGL
ncbi:MAG: tetratricopeptide repeat protein [Chloroflexota bacterium]|nr:tetratricopeptide repeat protein [Chloroflexota bacterium]